MRSFARWLRQFEPSTEVPDDSTFGRRQSRGTPHIYSEYQVGQLLAAARHLDASRGLRGVVYETLFGLIASTGLRVSEALALLGKAYPAATRPAKLPVEPGAVSGASAKVMLAAAG